MYVINSSGAEQGIFLGYQVNIMAAAALEPCVARPKTDMLSIMQD